MNVALLTGSGLAAVSLLTACALTGDSRAPASNPQPVATAPEPPDPATAGVPTSATSSANIAPGPLTKMRVERAFPGISFSQAVHLTYPDDGSGRLFLVLQPGRIVVFDNSPAANATETFLDVRRRVSVRGNEEGLLGMAFDPEYTENGHFYVYYSASAPRRSVISRFTVSAHDEDLADPDSEVVVLEVAQPYSNHNGGHLLFGPDGYLYIGLGDGGRAGDPHGNGQDTSTLLGSLLRLDVSALGSDGAYSIPPDNPFADGRGVARPEVWAYGLRNPWRFTFDRETGELWAADVGQNRYEEVDIVQAGGNYGWNVMEGSHCFVGSRCDREGLEQPVMEYDREGGCSITGGYVYRGARLPSLLGAYVYGDYCSGKIWALWYDGSGVTDHMELVDTELNISAFGEDPAGELFIISHGGGVYRLAAAE